MLQTLSSQRTGISWNLEPLNHLLPLVLFFDGGTGVGRVGELGDSKKSQDAVLAQRSREGDECGFARDAGPLSSCHLGEKTDIETCNTLSILFLVHKNKIKKNRSTWCVKHCRGVKTTHFAKLVVCHQVEVVHGEQVALQLTNGRKELVHHVGDDLAHLKHDAHEALQLFRQHHLK